MHLQQVRFRREQGLRTCIVTSRFPGEGDLCVETLQTEKLYLVTAVDSLKRYKIDVKYLND